eukprot:jgi/Tetstr1/456999/TSEL_043663.t2
MPWRGCGTPRAEGDASPVATPVARSGGGTRLPGCGCTTPRVEGDAEPREGIPAAPSQVVSPPAAPGASSGTAPIVMAPLAELGKDGDDSFFDALSAASWEDAMSATSWDEFWDSHPEEDATFPAVRTLSHEDAAADTEAAAEDGAAEGSEGSAAQRGESPNDNPEAEYEADGEQPPEQNVSPGSKYGWNPQELPLHRAVFERDVEEVTRLAASEPTMMVHKDSHGNTPLHVAAICGHMDAAEALLAAGAALQVKNNRGWSAMEHAISLRNRPMVKLLYTRRVAELRADVKGKKRELLIALKEMPDYKLKISWELGSSMFGYLLRRYAPSDTYEVWKLGNAVRVDGTLMGVEDNSKSLLPEWKRGQFSLLFHSAYTMEGKSKVYLVNHTTRKWVDLSAHKKKAGGDMSDMEVSLLMQDGAGKTRMRTSELRFKPLKSLFGYPVRERVEGWDTTVYEAQARLVAVTTIKTPFNLPAMCTFEQYLALQPAEDKVVERPVDPLSMEAFKGAKGGRRRSSDLGSTSRRRAAPRKVTGRCWMAEGFPMSLRQLLPLLDIIGYANKHLSKVSSFLSKYGNRELFPVKIQAPLMLTVFAMVGFRQFAELRAGEAALESSFYELPALYEKVSAEEMFGRSSPLLADSAKGGSDYEAGDLSMADFNQTEQDLDFT